jgi:hypothetical protein
MRSIKEPPPSGEMPGMVKFSAAEKLGINPFSDPESFEQMGQNHSLDEIMDASGAISSKKPPLSKKLPLSKKSQGRYGTLLTGSRGAQDAVEIRTKSLLGS